MRKDGPLGLREVKEGRESGQGQGWSRLGVLQEEDPWELLILTLGLSALEAPEQDQTPVVLPDPCTANQHRGPRGWGWNGVLVSISRADAN